MATNGSTNTYHDTRYSTLIERVDKLVHRSYAATTRCDVGTTNQDVGTQYGSGQDNTESTDKPLQKQRVRGTGNLEKFRLSVALLSMSTVQ